MIKSSLLGLILSIPVATAVAEDWPQWQGPDRNAISREKGLMQEWPENGPSLAWRIEGIGGGDSAPAVAGGKLFGLSNGDTPKHSDVPVKRTRSTQEDGAVED